MLLQIVAIYLHWFAGQLYRQALQLDQAIFRFFNDTLHNDVLDMIMPYWRDKKFWIPLYLLIAFIVVKRSSKKQAIAIILLTILTVALCDQISSSLFKPFFERLRPCKTMADVNALVGCRGSFSFVSSHATNHFGLATLWALVLPMKARWLTPALIVWAGSIAIGQVYVGVHYPSDIFCGALLGTTIAFILYTIAKRLDVLELKLP